MQQTNNIIKLNKEDIQNIILKNYNLKKWNVVSIDLNDQGCTIEFLDSQFFLNYYLNRKTMCYLPHDKDWYLDSIRLQFPATTYNLFKQLDIPFIRKVYYGIIEGSMKRNRIYDIRELNKKSIIGKYIAMMNLKGYMGFTFEDTFKLGEIDGCCPAVKEITITQKIDDVDINII